MLRSLTRCPALMAGFLVLVTVALAAVALIADAPARASHAGGMDAMSIDMDPSGNTATSLGPREFCARINENDVLDADEDAVDTLTIDVTATNIPASNPMLGYSYGLRYSQATLTVESQDPRFLLASAPGSGLIFNLSDPVPDPNETSPPWTVDAWLAGVLDLEGADGGLEIGSGVLDRLTISSEEAATPGLHLLGLDGESFHIDPDNNALMPDQLNNAAIAVGVDCGPVPTPSPSPVPTPTPVPTPRPTPAFYVDVEVASVTTTITASSSRFFSLPLEAVVRNNGPDEANYVSVLFIISGPTDCPLAYPYSYGYTETIPPGSTAAASANAGIWCGSPGPHAFTVTAWADASNVWVEDTNPKNNSQTVMLWVDLIDNGGGPTPEPNTDLDDSDSDETPTPGPVGVGGSQQDPTPTPTLVAAAPVPSPTVLAAALPPTGGPGGGTPWLRVVLLIAAATAATGILLTSRLRKPSG